MRLARHELDKALGWQRFADPVALKIMAAAHVEKFQLLARADAFGDDFQPEPACQADDRFGDCRIAGVGLQIGDE